MVYQSAKDARVAILARRKQGAHLQVEEMWAKRGISFAPLEWAGVPLAVLARQIATARFEDVVFKELAERSGFCPVWAENTTDCFVDRSSYKRSLVHPYICTGKGKQGPISKKVRLCDIQHIQRKRLSDIHCVSGEPLVAYHHKRRRLLFGEQSVRDFSSITSRIGSAREYYPLLLSLFVAHGVLFEDYHGGESGTSLDSFTSDVVEPAWKSVVKEIGYTPLIVRLPWWDGLQLYPDSHEWSSFGVVQEHLLAVHTV